MDAQTKAIEPCWLSKTFAGAILGITLALALSGLFAWLGPGGIAAADKVQFNMWLIPPLWLTLFSFVYMFPNGKSAWRWLLLANLLAYSALAITRYFLGAS